VAEYPILFSGQEEVVQYIDALAHKNSEALSFLPRPTLEHYAEVGQILIAHENGEPCGYLIHGNGARWCKIYQACIQYDARRREHGLELVRRLVRKALTGGFEAISLWCAEDLESNEFWRSAGFVWAGRREGGRRRGRKHNHWILWLQPTLFREEVSDAHPDRR
jgi:N-acetylglutamate synthase-like GNAT family acetyltransferase